MPTYYRKHDAKHITKGDLPHWSQRGALCFVTFRLGDSLPAQVVDYAQA